MSILSEALECQTSGKTAEAFEKFSEIIRLDPNNAVAHYSLAAINASFGQFENARDSINEALRINPVFAPSYLARSKINAALNQIQHALADAEKAVLLDPVSADNLFQRDTLAAVISRRAAPEASQGQRSPKPIADMISEADAMTAAGNNAAALALYEDELHLPGQDFAFVILFNMGVILSAIGQNTDAETKFRESLAVKPDFHMGHLNLGILLEKLGRADEAIQQWELAVSLPLANSAENTELMIKLLNNTGRLYEIQRRYDRAEEALFRSLKINSGQHDVLHHWVHLRQKQCKWGLTTELDLSEADIQRFASPLAILSLTDDPAIQLACAQRFTADKVEHHQRLVPVSRRYGHEKIRIGYLSSDLSMHAVSLLTVELFETHNRENVEVYAFCWSKEDGTPFRERVRSAFDHFIPIGGLTDAEAAELIRSHEIDVIVDLQGLTANARPNIVARGPAPVQIAYLGYPGPSAIPNVDYVVADPFIFPEELQPYFTEKPIYLPTQFQVSDSKRNFGPERPRSFFGLPDDCFVFCAFNNNYKISEEMFTSWMTILKNTPNSVLWLLEDNEWSKQNLITCASEQSIDPARVFFAGRIEPKDYLSRFRAADLFLDTTPYNAGTTANDALWAGLPLLTLSGQTYVSRMAGSLLRSAGLNELITFNAHDYEQRAIYLGTNPEELKRLKQHLKRQKDTGELFNTKRFCREFESALKALLEA